MIAPHIPSFDRHGVIPPIRPGQQGISPDRSPYPIDLLSFCQHFGGSQPRRVILAGLIELRAELYRANKIDGFQWIDGSFTEDVETVRNQPPNDIDVVTFAPLGDELSQSQFCKEFLHLVNPRLSKQQYKVDHYFFPTDVPFLSETAHQLAYWYSIWSHRRADNRWKGFVAVPLASNDAEAKAWLAQHEEPPLNSGGTP